MTPDPQPGSVVTSQWVLVLDWCCSSHWEVYRLFQNLSTALCWRDASLDNNQKITDFGADPCTQWWAVLTKLLSSSAHTLWCHCLLPSSHISILFLPGMPEAFFFYIYIYLKSADWFHNVHATPVFLQKLSKNLPLKYQWLNCFIKFDQREENIRKTWDVLGKVSMKLLKLFC